MYNLTVSEVHTYFVGAGQWVVHNAWECGDPVPNLTNSVVDYSKTPPEPNRDYEVRVTQKPDPELAAHVGNNAVEFDWFRVDGDQTILLDAKNASKGGICDVSRTDG